MLAQLSIPAGYVFQLRFIISSLSISLRGETLPVTLPSGNNTGLKIEPIDGVPFEIRVGERTAARVLFPPYDQLVRNHGQGFILKPVLEAEHVTLLDLSAIALDRVVVGFKLTTTAQQIAQINSGIGTTVINKWEPTNYYVLHLPTTTTLEDALAYYSGKNEVAYTLPDNLVMTRGSLTPCDPGFVPPTPFTVSNFPAAWDEVKYNDALGRTTVGKASAAIIGVIDSGFDLKNPDLLPNWFINNETVLDTVHPHVPLPDVNGNGVVGDFEDLNAYFKTQGGNGPKCLKAPDCFVDGDGDGLLTPFDFLPPYLVGDGIDQDHNGVSDDFFGADFGEHDTNVNYDSPSDNHGTAVAGVIGAVGRVTGCPVSSDWVAGAMWDAQILPIKVSLSKPPLSDIKRYFRSDIIIAIDYAAATRATVVNISAGFVLGRNPLSEEGNLVAQVPQTCAAEVIENVGKKFDAFMAALLSERKAIHFDWPTVGPKGKTLVVAAAPNCPVPLPSNGDRFFDCWASHRDSTEPIVVVTGWDTNPLKYNCEAALEAEGDDIDIAAPLTHHIVLKNGGGMTFTSGTSFAAPLVTGTIGLMVSKDPSLAGNADKLKDILLTNSPGHVFGCARNGAVLDAFQAVHNTP